MCIQIRAISHQILHTTLSIPMSFVRKARCYISSVVQPHRCNSDHAFCFTTENVAVAVAVAATLVVCNCLFVHLPLPHSMSSIGS